MSDTGGSAAQGRRLLTIAGGTLLFVALATFFAWALRPLVEGPRTQVATAVDAEPAPATAPARRAAARATLAAAPAAAPVAAPAAPPPTPAPAGIAPFRPEFKGPRVAILLTPVGADPAATQAAIESLPPQVGLAFSPYPPEARALARAARAAGHEVWLSLPMQPKSYPRVTPGPNTLLVRYAADENRRRLDWALGRLDAPVGVTNMMGSAFTESAPAMAPVIATLKERGLVLIDGRVSPRSVAAREAARAGLRHGVNDRFVDAGGPIDANLAALEAIARKSGSAVGFAAPEPGNVAAIKEWAAGLEARGILLVPPATLTAG